MHWVGLDGFNSSTVEQDGVESDCNGSTPAYSAWWKTFPGNSIQQLLQRENAGDAVIASVYFNSASGARHQQQPRPHRRSGEEALNLFGKACWSPVYLREQLSSIISQAPSSGSILPLADYGIESFVNVKIDGQEQAEGRHQLVQLEARQDPPISATTNHFAAPPSRVSNCSHAFSNTWKDVS